MKDQNENVVIHDGIKGMRHGVRRWRNYDGSLTEEGKERYNYYDKKGQKGVAKALEQNYYSKWDNSKGDSMATKNVKSAQSFVGDTEKTLDNLKFGVRNKDLSSMTNQELSDAIARGRLEQDYAKLYPTTVKTDTRKKLDKFLAIAGGVLALGVSASAIYSNMMTAQKNRNEAFDKSVDDSKVNSAVKNFLSDIGNKKVDDIINMDQSTFNVLKNNLKERSDAWKNLQNLTGASKQSSIDQIADAVRERLES